MVRELSGLAWVPRFPTSKSTDSLVDGFRQKCEAFLAALADAGATVSTSATLRPPERAYLMHWSFVVRRPVHSSSCHSLRPFIAMERSKRPSSPLGATQKAASSPI